MAFRSGSGQSDVIRAERRRFAIVACLGLSFLCSLALYYLNIRSAAFSQQGLQTMGTVDKAWSRPCELFETCGRSIRYRLITEIEFLDEENRSWTAIKDRGSWGNQNRDRVGDSYKVWYLKDNPATNFIGSMGYSERAWFIGKWLSLIGMLLFAGAGAWVYLVYDDHDYPDSNSDWPDGSWYWD